VVTIKRSVIQIANSTQLISLPRKWSQKYGVKKGDELEIEENGSDLIIRTKREISSIAVEIDFKGQESLIHRAISSIYKAGYDEIKILFEKPSELELVQSTINQELIGFEIVDEGKNHIIAKQVSNIEHSEFDAMLRRTFIFLLSTADEALETLKTNNRSAFKNLVFRDITINKLTDYCRRSLNKKESHFKHTGPGYTIIELLEKIGDDYKSICAYCSENSIKTSKFTIQIVSEINQLLRDTNKLFYDFNLNEMRKFLERKNIIDKTTIAWSKIIRKDEVLLLLHSNSLAKNIFDLNGPIMANAL